jgi:SAM-dependent methyltransferase
VTGCAWCGVPFDARTERLAGRWRCAACGTATTMPWPSAAELDAAYAGWYRPPAGRFSGPGDVVLRRLRARLAGRLDAIAPPGRMLDVGAGDGNLVRALRGRGRDAEGLERADRDVDDLDGEWAAVVFWHSLEHLPRAREALAHAARLLAPGGVVVLAVPNAGSLQARAFGDRWFHLDLPRHLVHLPARTLTARLRSLGLRVTRVSHWRGGQLLFGWLHGLVGSLPGRPDLYDAIRRPEARSRPITARTRALALGAGVALFPVAALATALEVALRRGGTVYVEARRA